MEREIYREMESTEDRHWWFEGRRDVLRSLIEGQLRRKARPHILDVGCGTGGNLPFLQKFGDLDACEYDAEARAIASRKSGIDVKKVSIPDDMDGLGEDYDLVTLLDVLEHLEDDVASLEALAHRLSEGGHVLLTVPAMPWLWSDHDVKHHHFRRYTHATLHAAIVQAGLKPKRIGYFNSLLFPLALAQRVMSKFSEKAANAADVPPDWMNTPFRKIFGFEGKLVNRMKFPAGLSLYAVARKA